MESVADLLAHAIFFVIELSLFGLGDMASVLAGVKALLGADAAVLGMKIGCLGAGELALLAFLVNPARLVVQAAIHFGPARMLLGPRSRRSARNTYDADGQAYGDGGKCTAEIRHVSLHSLVLGAETGPPDNGEIGTLPLNAA
jgi:hypothetical protein